MKQLFKLFTIALLGGVLVFSTSCGASHTVRGGGIGAAAGAAVGAGVGAIVGGGQGAAWGAGIGAVAGGTAGAIIGNRMDQQARELADLEGAQVERIEYNDNQAIRVTFEGGILFATNRHDLNPASQEALNRFAQSLLNNPDTDIKIHGHADNTGTDAINDPLSKRRAESVASFLQSRGVAASRIESDGFGSRQPVADNATAAGRALNRRVEVFIIPNEKMISDAEREAAAGQQ
jgi:outer membrane protein OmpA-like peptidoglycan-associated protein